MRRVGIAMFLLGAGTLLGTLPLPDPDTSDHPAIRIIALLLAAGGIATWLVRDYRPWFSRGSVVYGLLLVSALMGVTRPIEATPFFYLWPVLFSAYFFSRRETAAIVAIMWVTMAIALLGFSNDPMKGVMLMGTGVSVTVAALVVLFLREHLTDVIGRLETASATDYLTGLPNRRAFDVELDRQLARALRGAVPLSLVILDLDHFKEINDRNGHAAGDRALCELADLLRRERRAGDTLARLGGEEFAIVLFGTDAPGARSFAQRLIREVHGLTVEQRPLSASAGVATMAGEAAERASLLLAADRALYAAKNAGRARVASWGTTGVEVGEPVAVAFDIPDGAPTAAGRVSPAAA
jgi:diguanylate cyclase (GGDEF)-like protein